jgi:hypothetical protein
MTTPLIVINKCMSEIGLLKPKSGYKVFANNPLNIKEARLNPTEYNSVSILSSSCNLRIRRIIIPGMKVR